jgi:putative FmdB family regulatory protein
MPVYTYRCANCGAHFERQQSFKDEPLKVCPECHKRTLKKVIAPVRIVFKGSGFYATDHKSPSGNGSKKAAKKDDKEPAKESTPAKETKAAEKSE